MKLGVSSYSFAKHIKETECDLFEVCRLAKEIGFAAIEFINITTPDPIATAKELREYCASIDLEIAAYTIGADLLNGDEEEILQKLYDFVWDELCDWYIELTKTRLYDKECPTRLAAQQTLCHVLSETLKLLHPFMPFITEEIWQHLPHVGESIMVSDWPNYDEKNIYKEEEERIERIKETIREIRNTRSQMNVPPSKRAHGFVVTSVPELYEGGAQFFEKLCGITPLTVIGSKDEAPENSVCVIVSKAEVYIPLDELIDREKEIARLQKEEANLQNEVKRLNGKLSNAGFVAKAPAAVVEEERQKLAKYEQMLEKVQESLAQLLG